MVQRKILVFFTLLGMACLLALAGCGTSEHAAVMSGETVDQQAKRAQAKASEKGGIPLKQGAFSQESLESGSGRAMAPGTSGDIDESSMSSIAMGSGSSTSPSGGSVSSRTLDLGKAGEAGSSSGSPSELEPLAGYMPGLPTQPRSFGESAGGRAEGSSGSSPGGGQPGNSAQDFFSPGSSGYEGEEFVRGLTPSDLFPDDPTNPNLAMAGKGRGKESRSRTGSSGSGEEMVSEPGIQPLAPIPDTGSEMSSSIQVAGVTYTLNHVFFDYDRSFIRPDAVTGLKNNARLLNAELQDSQVLVQGHCDERGTNKYNLVLGERRAQSVKKYLVDLGIDASRISTISYGEEKPFCTQFTPACLQKNRRGHFVLQ